MIQTSNQRVLYNNIATPAFDLFGIEWGYNLTDGDAEAGNISEVIGIR